MSSQSFIYLGLDDVRIRRLLESTSHQTHPLKIAYLSLLPLLLLFLQLGLFVVFQYAVISLVLFFLISYFLGLVARSQLEILSSKLVSSIRCSTTTHLPSLYQTAQITVWWTTLITLAIRLLINYIGSTWVRINDMMEAFAAFEDGCSLGSELQSFGWVL